MRLIDADALEELFREVIGGIAKRPEINGNLEHMIRASAMVVEMIKDAPTINQQPHWIPCSERLPEEDNVEVLCTVKQQSKTNRSETIIVEQGCYFYGTWLLSYDNQRVNCSREVLAWQPLPSPYQEEGEEE